MIQIGNTYYEISSHEWAVMQAALHKLANGLHTAQARLGNAFNSLVYELKVGRAGRKARVRGRLLALHLPGQAGPMDAAGTTLLYIAHNAAAAIGAKSMLNQGSINLQQRLLHGWL